MASEHATTGDAINHAVDKASEGLSQIAHALSSAAPQAWTVAVHGVYARGLATILAGCFEIILALTMMAVAYSVGRRGDWKDGDLFSWGAVIIFVGAMLFLIGSFFDFANSDAWARVISPDGYLAQQVLRKAL